MSTGARAKAWCLLIHAKASLSLYLSLSLSLSLSTENEHSTHVVFQRTESARLYDHEHSP